MKKVQKLINFIVSGIVISLFSVGSLVAQSPQSGSIGIQGTIPSDPPQTAPTISIPTNGQSFQELPVTVNGICTANLELRIFRNGVFAGSTFCDANGNYILEIDLFSGENLLIARSYDALGQASPDSNQVNVSFAIPSDDDGVEQLLLTSNFSVRGANPNELLRWPISVSGGRGPYAFSVDWGDGFVEPISSEVSGQLEFSHTYSQPGVYKVIVKATDSRGETAFLQLVAIANGPVSDNPAGAGGAGGGQGGVDGPTGDFGPEPIESNRPQFILWPIYLMFFFVVSTFWIGRRFERRYIKQKLYNRENIKF